MLIKNSDAAQTRADATTNRARSADTANQPKYAGASTGRKKRARPKRGKSEAGRTGEGSTLALRRDEAPVAAKDNRGRLRRGDAPAAGPEHYRAVTDVMRANGIDPAEWPEIVQRAAQIHAREGAPPDGAFVLAVSRELVDSGYLDPKAVSTAGAMMRDKQGRLRRRGDDAIAAYRSEWYPHSMENIDRCDALVEILQQQGPFTVNEAMMAFWPGTPKTDAVKERVAIWLRTQLKKLRKGDRLGEHPVRRHKALSKIGDRRYGDHHAGNRILPWERFAVIVRGIAGC
jgi:hypothetical protein